MHGGGLGVVRDLPEGISNGGQLIGLAVEELCHGRKEALVDAFFALMAGNFFNPEHFNPKAISNFSTQNISSMKCSTMNY